MSVGGIEAFHSIFRPLLFASTFVDTPNPYHHPAGDRAGQVVLEQVEDILRGSGETYCAIIAEPLIQAAGGMLTHPPGFLASLRRLTRQYGLLLIADEVATGFARTGKLFACNHEQVCPDLMCLGKGLTGGYLPVAATLATEAVFEAFGGEVSEGRTFYHGHTYTGNALGCAAGTACIDLIFETGLLEALGRKVETIRARLTELRGHPNVGDIRQCGMMVGIELVADRDKREAFGSDKHVGQAVCKHARKHDIIIRPLGDVVVLMPAPAMDNKTLERLMTGVIATIREFFE
jgi:adenosylmethionine-8-amino-7-oxononanoate aminotransferase